MSITIGYFFNSPIQLAGIRDRLEFVIGCRLAHEERDKSSFFGRHLGMELTLGRHWLVNDRELDFESFRHELRIRTAMPAAKFRPLQSIAMTSLAYAMYLCFDITGILVFDVQTLLARYTVRNERLFDEVSDKFVEFPGHVQDVCGRVPAKALGSEWEQGVVEFLRDKGRDVRIDE